MVCTERTGGLDECWAKWTGALDSGRNKGQQWASVADGECGLPAAQCALGVDLGTNQSWAFDHCQTSQVAGLRAVAVSIRCTGGVGRGL